MIENQTDGYPYSQYRVVRNVTLVSAETGVRHEFTSITDADKFLGYAPGYLSQKRYETVGYVTKKHETEKYYVIIGSKTRRFDDATIRVETKPPIGYSYEDRGQLCWSCKKACGYCSWSFDFTPVKGWKAQPTRINGNASEDTSYRIYECPEYVNDNQ